MHDLLRIFVAWCGLSTGFFTACIVAGKLLDRLEELAGRRRALRIVEASLAADTADSFDGVAHGNVHDAFYFSAGDREAMLAILRTMAPRAMEN